MATAFEILIQHLKLAIRQLEELSSGKQCVIDEDQLIDLADQITGLVLDFTDPGSPMRGYEVAALIIRGIITTTSLNTLSTEDEVAIRTLLDTASSLQLTK